MAYSKQTWSSNELITANKLNHIEDGIPTKTSQLTNDSGFLTSVASASQSAAGLMSANDKKKLDGIAAGAQVNSITGVKGGAEGSYRTGDVNLTPADIAFIGINPTGGTSNDTRAWWTNKGTCYAFISSENQVNGQPATYGFIVNIAYASEIYQMWLNAPGGARYHRGGNNSTSAMPSWTADDTNIITSVNGQTGAVSVTPANIGAVPIPTGNNLPDTGDSDLNDSPLGWSISHEVEDATAQANAHMPFRAWCYIYTIGSEWKTQMAFPWYNTDEFAIRRMHSDGTWTEWTYNVTGIKGNAESTYRTGYVNLTPADIGAVAKSGDTMTGPLTVTDADIIQTTGYLKGESSSYTNHAIKLGRSNDDKLQFFEYGGQFDFYKSQNGSDTLLFQVKDGISTKPLPVNNGGTGATNKSDARTNLGVFNTPSGGNHRFYWPNESFDLDNAPDGFCGAATEATIAHRPDNSDYASIFTMTHQDAGAKTQLYIPWNDRSWRLRNKGQGVWNDWQYIPVVKCTRLEAGVSMENGAVNLGWPTKTIPLSAWSTNIICRFFVKGSTSTWWIQLIDVSTGASLTGTSTTLPINVTYIEV